MIKAIDKEKIVKLSQEFNNARQRSHDFMRRKNLAINDESHRVQINSSVILTEKEGDELMIFINNWWKEKCNEQQIELDCRVASFDRELDFMLFGK